MATRKPHATIGMIARTFRCMVLAERLSRRLSFLTYEYRRTTITPARHVFLGNFLGNYLTNLHVQAYPLNTNFR